MRGPAAEQEAYYSGVPMARYDLVKELALALLGTLVLVIVLAAALSSPDAPPLTIRSWAQNDPVDFVTTATSELAGTSLSAQYGPPYNESAGSVQSFGFIAPQKWAGVQLPVSPAEEFVLQPLRYASSGNPALKAALDRYQGAPQRERQAWLDAYGQALGKATARGGQVVVRPGAYGPLPRMMSDLLAVARSGGLDGLLLNSGRFYQSDFTLPLLFMGDGGYLADHASSNHLLGSQWGMMNETGSYPGQTWLWLYTMWYQIPPFNSSANADLLVLLTTGVLTVALALLPFIPVLRSIPHWVPIYRLVWRRYYADATRKPAAEQPVIRR